jgi:hypothetical protein
MRVIHASVEVPAIDIAIKGGELIANDLRYGQLSAPREFQSGIYDLEARLQGTGVVEFDLPGEVVNPGMVHRLVM